MNECDNCGSPMGYDENQEMYFCEVCGFWKNS